MYYCFFLFIFIYSSLEGRYLDCYRSLDLWQVDCAKRPLQQEILFSNTYVSHPNLKIHLP